jgi:hypothetical protein
MRGSTGHSRYCTAPYNKHGALQCTAPVIVHTHVDESKLSQGMFPVGLVQQLENLSGLVFVSKVELEWTFSKTQVLRSTRARIFQQSKLEVPSSHRNRDIYI